MKRYDYEHVWHEYEDIPSLEKVYYTDGESVDYSEAQARIKALEWLVEVQWMYWHMYCAEVDHGYQTEVDAFNEVVEILNAARNAVEGK